KDDVGAVFSRQHVEHFLDRRRAEVDVEALLARRARRRRRRVLGARPFAGRGERGQGGEGECACAAHRASSLFKRGAASPLAPPCRVSVCLALFFSNTAERSSTATRRYPCTDSPTRTMTPSTFAMEFDPAARTALS